MAMNYGYSDEPSQQLGTRTGGGFPPASGGKGMGDVHYAKGAVPKVGPTSTGKGGIAASLKVKKAGTQDAPGLEKTVNLF